MWIPGRRCSPVDPQVPVTQHLPDPVFLQDFLLHPEGQSGDQDDEMAGFIESGLHFTCRFLVIR